MTDQVNPLGSLAPGMAQILQATSSLPAKPPPKTSESKAPSQEKRAGGVSKENLEASTKEGLDAAVKEIQASLQQLPVDVKYGVDRETGMYYFKLIDPATQEVIRQVPSEEIMAMSKRLRDLSDGQGTSGVLMDKEG
jgi:flagellar protein FlaG